MSLTEFMKKIDVYGSPYNFTIFSQPTYTTVIGGIATIFTFLLYIFCFFQFGTDFWMHKNPHFLNQKITLATYPKYTLNRNDLLVGFRVEDIDGNYIDVSRLLNISIIYYQYEMVEGTLIPTISTINMINCSLIDKNSMKIFTKRDLSNIMCLDFQNTTLGGFWDGNFLNYIMINFNACVNSSENNNTCMDYKEGYDYLSKGMPSFNIYTGSYFTELEDYDNPLKLNLFNQYNYVDPDKGKNLRLFYKVANMTTDLGIISSVPNKYSIFGLDYIVTDSTPVNPPFLNATSDTKLCSIEIYLLNKIEFFNVTYIKLQEILATIGGLLSTISMFFSFFIGFINEHYRNIEIINNLFDFSEIKEEEKIEKLLEHRLKEKINIKHDNDNDKTKKGDSLVDKAVIVINDVSSQRHLKKNDHQPDNDFSFSNMKPSTSSIIHLQEMNSKDVINLLNKKDVSLVYDENGDNKKHSFVIPKPDDGKLKDIDSILNNKDVFSLTNKNDVSQIGNDENSEQKFKSLVIPNPNDSKIKEIDKIKINNIKDWVQKYERSVVNFEVGVWLKFKNLICPKSLSSKESFYIKLYNRSLEIINSKMDMINYLKFMQEYIHVKCFLFNDLQSLCLGFIKKPKIFEKSRFVTINSKSHKQLKEIIQFFKEKKDLSQKDMKIYDLLSDEIKMMIYKFKDHK